MNIDQVKTVLELNRTRHFKKTAQALFVTQSTISARLQSLEDELECKLFERTSRTIEITPAGERFIGHARSMLALWRRAKQEIHIEADESFRIAVGGLFITWDIFVLEWLERLHADFPSLSLTAESHDHSYLLRQLLDGAMDLIFIYEPPKLTDVVFTKVIDLQLTLVSDKPNQNLKEALETNYTLVHWGEQFLMDHNRALRDYDLPQKRVNQARIALNFILSSGGAAFLPSQMIAPFIEEKSLFKVKGIKSFPLRIYAVYMKSSANIGFVEKSLSYL
ncbi:MAG: LysR family transcriptional regulator [Cocleimonas sp.]